MNKIQEHWDMEIRPGSNLFDLHLKDLWHYRDLLLLLVRRDFVSFYKQTIFGPLWFFIQPIFTTIIFTFVFSKMAGISTEGIPPPLFYLTGTVAWNYFADCLTKTSTVFKDNATIFGKVYFPRLIIPISAVLVSLFDFLMAFIILISNMWGLFLKEWKGVPTKTLRLFIIGLFTILASIVLVGIGNSLK